MKNLDHPSRNFIVISIYVFCFFTSFLGFSQSQVFTSGGTFTVPVGITTITVEGWGGGGGGGAATGNLAGGGGGAGGAYARKVITVTPGQTFAVTIGTGGTVSTTTAGGTGTNTIFGNTSTLVAQGGLGGGLASANNTGGTGGVGASGSSIGDIVRKGGDGASGAANGSVGGGGGESGGYSGPGNPGKVTVGGFGLYDGGNGGNAGNNSNGNAGTTPGGGGGGGDANSTTDRSGGAGARGELRVYWCTSAPLIPSLTSFENRQDPGDLNLSICPGTLIGGGGENDIEIFNNAAGAAYQALGSTYLWEVSASYDNGITFSAFGPAANGTFPLSGIAGTQSPGAPFYNTDFQYPFYAYFNTDGIYKFRLKVSNACGTSISAGTGGVIQVTVGGAIATSSTTGLPDEICNSAANEQTLTLSGSSVGGGALTGQWTVFSSTPALPNTTNPSPYLSNTTFQNNTNIPLTVFDPPVGYVGTVVLRLTTEVVAGACPGAGNSSSFSDRTVIVGGAPTVTCPANITTDNCNATTVTYTANASNAATVTYSFGGATIGSGSGTGTGSNFGIGITTVTITATNACGNASCSFTVTVPNASSIFPTFAAVPTSFSICAGSSVPSLPTTSDNGINGNWSPTTINNTNSGTYIFTPGSGQCAANYTANVNVNPAPNAGTDGTLTVCAGTTPTDAELFAVLGGSPDAGGTWTNAGLVYTYTVTATAPCTMNATATVTVTEQAAPNAGSNGTLTVCAGTTPTDAELFAELGGSPDAGGTWTNAGLVYTYTVTATAPCTMNATATVTVTETPGTNSISGFVKKSSLTGVTISDLDGVAYVSLIRELPIPTIVATSSVASGTFNFQTVCDGEYLLVLHNLSSGSLTPIIPSAAYSAFAVEGTDNGTVDATADGKLKISVSSNTITVMAKIAATPNPVFALTPVALPVRLISLNAKATDKGNALTWKTNAEQNFSHFEVERSIDANGFEKLANVDGAGNSKETINYNYLDTKVAQNNYYRLKMVDLDGTSEYSKVVFIQNKLEASLVGEFYPNPAYGSEFSININSESNATWTITSYDLSGRVLNTETRQLVKGENKLKFQIKINNSGISMYSFQNANGLQFRKLSN